MKLQSFKTQLSFILLLLIIAVPFPVAAQNIVGGVALIASIICLKRNFLDGIYALSKTEFLGWIALFVWLAIRAVIGILYGNFAERKLLEIIFGYIGLLLLPILLSQVIRNQFSRHAIFKLFSQATAIICISWLVISITQRFLGWAFYNGTVHWNIFRAQGLYSHPLTLAYVLALVLPLTLRASIAVPTSWKRWLVFVSCALVVVLNESRAVQVASIGVCCWMTFVRSSRKLRIRILGGLAIGSFIVAIVPNPVERKFRNTFLDASLRSDSVPDDRVVFWQAHWLLVKERPLLGWGAEIPDIALKNAYREIGRSDFAKKYNAHNVYLQTLTESGIVGLISLMFWGVSVCVMSRRVAVTNFKNPTDSYCIGDGAFFGFINFFIASLTQNSIYDSEVRYAFMVLLTAVLSVRLFDQTVNVAGSAGS